MNEPHTNPIDTPDQALSKLIVAALLKRGLVPPTHQDDIQRKLSNGKVSASDWKLWIDISKSREERKP